MTVCGLGTGTCSPVRITAGQADADIRNLACCYSTSNIGATIVAGQSAFETYDLAYPSTYVKKMIIISSVTTNPPELQRAKNVGFTVYVMGDGNAALASEPREAHFVQSNFPSIDYINTSQFAGLVRGSERSYPGFSPCFCP